MPLGREAVVTGSADSSAGGCQLSSSSSGNAAGPAAACARCVSIAALTAIRFSHDLTLPRSRQVAVGAEEGLLRDIRRLVAIGDHPHDEREQLVLVDRDEVVERVEVAVADASSRIRSRRWMGSTTSSVEGPPGRRALRTAISRRGESSIGFVARRCLVDCSSLGDNGLTPAKLSGALHRRKARPRTNERSRTLEPA